MTLEQLSSGALILHIDDAFFLVSSSVCGDDQAICLRKECWLDVQSFFFVDHFVVMVFVLVLVLLL